MKRDKKKEIHVYSTIKSGFREACTTTEFGNQNRFKSLPLID